MDFISLSQFEEQIILGGLLGDAYFNKKANKIRFSQGEKQYEYLLWKKKNFLNNINDNVNKINKNCNDEKQKNIQNNPIKNNTHLFFYINL